MVNHSIVIIILIKEFLGRIKTYEQARDEMMRTYPEMANYFHDELRAAILDRLGRPGSKELQESLAEDYRKSISDQNDLGD